MKGLTPKQKELYEFIIKYQAEKSIIPSLPVMAEYLHVSIPRIQHIISALSRKKYLVRKNIYEILSPANGVPLEAESIKNPDAKAEDSNILTN